MATTVGNVLAGKPLTTGGVLWAPTGSTAPTDATTALDAAFLGLGYVGEEGVTENADRSSNKLKAWGGDIVKVVQTEFSYTIEFTMIESLNAEVLKAAYGDDNVTTTPGAGGTTTLHEVVINGDILPHKSIVAEIKDGLAKIRLYIPDGQITTVGAITYKDDSYVAYPVTVEGFKDTTSGGNAVKWLDDGIVVA